jgi:CheY-like chemotaxis protein
VSCRVLVIEDEVIVGMMVEDMLTELGCEVTAIATHFTQALELARTAAVDFAVLDVNLNGKQSFPIADTLAARGIPFAFATGYGGKALSGSYADTPTLQKPFQVEDMAAVLRLYALIATG